MFQTQVCLVLEGSQCHSICDSEQERLTDEQHLQDHLLRV